MIRFLLDHPIAVTFMTVWAGLFVSMILALKRMDAKR